MDQKKISKLSIVSFVASILALSTFFLEVVKYSFSTKITLWISPYILYIFTIPLLVLSISTYLISTYKVYKNKGNPLFVIIISVLFLLFLLFLLFFARIEINTVSYAQ